MTACVRAGVIFALCAGVAGCAAPLTSAVTTASVASTKAIPAGQASAAVIIGKSTRADVAAALGKATVVSFDSGFEVWVYPLADDRPAAATPPARVGLAGAEQVKLDKSEFVLLFAPTGVVAKTRVRFASRTDGVTEMAAPRTLK